eukprot:Gb_04790 [translate_table: standard]
MGCGLMSPTRSRIPIPSAILGALTVSSVLGSHRNLQNQLGCSATLINSHSKGGHRRLLSSFCLVPNPSGHTGYGLVGRKRLDGRNKRMPTAVLARGFFGFGNKVALPELVEAGDPVLHECASEVPLEEIGSERIEKIIDDMIAVMRNAPGCGLAAPQIGVPLQMIVLEDTKEYISYAPKEETEAQQRYPFDLLIIINPKLKIKGNKTAKFFEGCLSVDGFRGLVERHLEVEVTGLGRDGLPIKVSATGWKARILQHECDHLAGVIYVDKLIPRTFRTVKNLTLPLAAGCPKPGIG